jgi:hypothetical protein
MVVTLTSNNVYDYPLVYMMNIYVVATLGCVFFFEHDLVFAYLFWCVMCILLYISSVFEPLAVVLP